MRVVSSSETRITVDVGEAYDTVGSGGTFVLERAGPGSYRIVEELGQWIA